jgi:hypothetical protein
LGTLCDRQVVGKMAAVPEVPKERQIVDSWPAIKGTSVHQYLEQVFLNDPVHPERWLVEHKVSPMDGVKGTADLYDITHKAVVDHKVLGRESMARLRRNDPPAKYRNQLLLYARGYRNLGLDVERIAIIGYPVMEASLDGMFVWSLPCTVEEDARVDQLIELTERRRRWADSVINKEYSLDSITATPSQDECTFCPYYRPLPIENSRQYGCRGINGE